MVKEIRGLEVPTQEWLAEHSAWYEEAQEEAQAAHRARVLCAIVSVLWTVAAVWSFVFYGGV